jgi:hypothetical protein
MYSSFSQTNPVAGNLPFATQVGGPYDFLDLATGNVLITVPVRAKNEKIPFSFALSANSLAYAYPYNSGHGTLYQWDTAFTMAGAEHLQVRLVSSTRTITCSNGAGDEENYAFAVIDASGTSHPFPANVKVDNDGM